MSLAATPDIEAGLYIGLMSGTSMDGVDAVLAEFSAPVPKLIATHYLPYPQGLAERLLALQIPAENELHIAARLGIEVTRLYDQAIKALLGKTGADAAAIQAIGCHGQTVRHNPGEGYTLQLCNPALLAELSGIGVVADFRSRDIAAGGEGAPLVPAFHEAVFRSPAKHRVILNVGGIANVTDLNPRSATTGFDTGPGNVLLDAWTRLHTGQAFDADGAWAAAGQVNPRLLDALLGHPYLALTPPKSCGREQFNLGWLESRLNADITAVDVQATLLEFTAGSVAAAIRRWCGVPDELVVCGGGAHNKTLLERLGTHLPQTRVFASDSLGIDADWVEAAAFAWLARQTLLGLPGNLPAVTGCKGARVLGAIYPR
ncbi:MAG: anhydro-N-acetylmuramic acid kinase [Zoogloeaceae bacterium]|jgi:anhydro-N-acetylmuramic acid kinase|nr:anhydro-N-acetylmuramic acid kinase [Zoogloeaceae bacterium]